MSVGVADVVLARAMPVAGIAMPVILLPTGSMRMLVRVPMPVRMAVRRPVRMGVLVGVLVLVFVRVLGHGASRPRG